MFRVPSAGRQLNGTQMRRLIGSNVEEFVISRVLKKMPPATVGQHFTAYEL